MRYWGVLNTPSGISNRHHPRIPLPATVQSNMMHVDGYLKIPGYLDVKKMSSGPKFKNVTMFSASGPGRTSLVLGEGPPTPVQEKSIYFQERSFLLKEKGF